MLGVIAHGVREEKCAAAADRAVSDQKDGKGQGGIFSGQAEDVLIPEMAGDDHLFFQGSGQGLDLVADEGGPLKLQVARGLCSSAGPW